MQLFLYTGALGRKQWPGQGARRWPGQGAHRWPGQRAHKREARAKKAAASIGIWRQVRLLQQHLGVCVTDGVVCPQTASTRTTDEGRICAQRAAEKTRLEI
eukprot:scaffold12559_cov125-Isochrysis_galbana.AAC.7